ncbi:MAG: ABC transporter ATP-binding protein [Planctomycetota bacterium]|nr:MAG: ABC transporter ATP-binding protein [Planctomycetota bacterium]
MTSPPRTEPVEVATKPLKPKKTRWLRVWRTFLPFARPHRRPFWLATGAALAVVGSRLAFPLPLKGLLKPWLKGEHAAEAPEGAVLYGLAFFGVVLAMGLADYYQRLQVARFSIGWVRDIRAEAFRAAARVDPRAMSLSSGELVARLVGDTARLKAGLKGFLTHVATNGAYFLGVTLILLLNDWILGSVIAAASILVLGVTWYGARRLYRRYLELRKKEGKLATRIQEALEEDPLEGGFARVNYSSGRHEATVVRIQGQTTVASYFILGLCTLGALAVGIQGHTSGRVSADTLFLFFAYALMLIRHAVKLSRQGTRIGKMMACGERLERLIRAGRKAERKEVELAPLTRRLKLQGVRVVANNRDGNRSRLGPLDLEIRAGEKVAVTGPAGSGKTTLLELLAGSLELSEGKIRWDEAKLHKLPVGAIAAQVGHLGSEPFWLRKTLRESLGLGPGEPGREAREILADCGLERLLDRLPAGLETKLGPGELSRREARRVALAAALLRPASLLLLDEPFLDLPVGAGERLARRILGHPGTVLAGLADPAAATGFDRVLRLEAGRLAGEEEPA